MEKELIPSQWESALDYVTGDDFVDSTGDDRFRDHLADICDRYFPGKDWTWSQVAGHFPATLIQEALKIYDEEMA